MLGEGGCEEDEGVAVSCVRGCGSGGGFGWLGVHHVAAGLLWWFFVCPIFFFGEEKGSGNGRSLRLARSFGRCNGWAAFRRRGVLSRSCEFVWDLGIRDFLLASFD